MISLGLTQPGKLPWQDRRPLSQPSGIKKAPKPREDRGISVCVPVILVLARNRSFHVRYIAVRRRVDRRGV